ncbi:putative toxin-antitoxin system toxin component, PIN family [Mucilaginibacter sp.]|uniref:putative toxin-antitoxin system toxin component, PIN family n=1 Tax=Mucilaginibacter sp. TaxID=1882438 RepID=UPI00326379F0
MLRIVLDTNVLVASISRRSPYHWVWKSFLQSKYKLCITTDILDEYAEIVERFFSVVDAEHTLTQIMLQTNVVKIIRYYEWNIIEKDPDDNKFFDCAVAANADYIVSEDKHFEILRQIPFPSVTLLKVAQFKQLLDAGVVD